MAELDVSVFNPEDWARDTEPATPVRTGSATEELTEGRTEERTEEQTEELTEGRTEELTEGRTEERTEEWAEEVEREGEGEVPEPALRPPPTPPPWSIYFSSHYMRVLCTVCFAGNRDLRNAKCANCYRVEREELKKQKEAMRK